MIAPELLACINPLDRTFRVTAPDGAVWTMVTNGHLALCSPGEPAEDHSGTLSTRNGPADTLAIALKTDVEPASADALRAFVIVPCETCKGSRSSRCSKCFGTGHAKHTCDDCGDEHTCVCWHCDEGVKVCECAKRAHRREVLGDLFNAHLIAVALAHVGGGPLLLGIASLSGGGKSGHLLVLRAGDRLAGVMSMIRDETDTEIPVWCAA